MDITRAIGDVAEKELKAELASFLADFMSPAFGSLPKREIELRVFDLMRMDINRPVGPATYVYTEFGFVAAMFGCSNEVSGMAGYNKGDVNDNVAANRQGAANLIRSWRQAIERIINPYG